MARKRRQRGNLPALGRYWTETIGTRPKTGQFTRLLQRFGRDPGEFEDPEALAAWWHNRIVGMSTREKYKKLGKKFGKREKKK